MSLTEELTKRREAARKFIPPEKLAIMDRCTEDLARSGIIQSALKQGDTAPAFVLPNATGTMVSLTELLERGPVVLSFYRGGW
jgi:hypothetical protein